MGQMNSQEAEDIVNRETKIIYYRRCGWLVSKVEITRIIPRNYWLLTSSACRQSSYWSMDAQPAPDWSMVTHSSSRQELWEMRARSRSRVHDLRTNMRITAQSSASPHHCDTELLRVRKISVLCFSLQKRTTKIGHKKLTGYWSLGVVNHQARIIWNNCDLTALWCTPFHLVATHFKVGINNWSSQ